MKKVLVISGDGINCENETAAAFKAAGGVPAIIHVNELLTNPDLLLEYSIFCVPGGFSFGDELRSGKILAEKMRLKLSGVFKAFTEKGGLTLGVCNGFQVLIQLGAFADSNEVRTATLVTNSHGKFLDRWVELEFDRTTAQKSPWFRGISGRIELPMRHKEGRILLSVDANGETLHMPLHYLEDVNGSYQKSAALLDETGRILGIMPHPEAATHAFLNPLLSEFKEENAIKVRQIFKNAIEWSV
jgi:phosphoribosylformylglycinamidine (FGAM) synthase-like amidotransferase family enzyme